MKLEAPLVFNDGFSFTRHFRIQCDDKEFTVLLEMVKSGKAYSDVQHDKCFTAGIMLELQRTVVNQS